MHCRKWFEDLPPGTSFECGHYLVTREEVIEFAGKYDPQPYHLDDAAAAANPIFGRLCASALHTIAMGNVLVQRLLRQEGIAPIAGGGLDELRLWKPVFPGDELHVRLVVLTARLLRSHPDRGVVTFSQKILNQEGDIVLSFSNALFFGKRPAAA